MIRRCIVPVACLALVTVLTVPALARDSHGEKGNGKMKTVTFDVADCDEIVLKCGLDIDINFGDQQKIALTMDENLVGLYEIAERSGRLLIAAEKSPRPSDGARLELTLASLSRVKIDGAGDITVEDFNGDELELAISGAGDVEIDGEVGELEIRIDGAGDIDAKNLEARRAEVTVNGAGDVRMFASESADVTINGVGDVDVYGDPEELDMSVHGIGSVSRH